MPMAQESWVVIKGKVKVFYYDIDDKLLITRDMNPFFPKLHSVTSFLPLLWKPDLRLKNGKLTTWP